MLMLLAALQSEYGVPDPQQLEGLMAGLAAGDRESLAQLYHRTRAAVYGLALSILGSGHDAEDVTQTVLLKLYQQGDRFESEEHRKHWLLRVAVNESRRLLRSFWRSRAVPLDEQWDAPVSDDPAKRELFQAVMGLETKYRLTIYLYYYEGCSVKEVAAALHANPSTVQTWLQRARERLRRELSEEEEGKGYV